MSLPPLCCRLREIPAGDLTLPCQAVQARLSGVSASTAAGRTPSRDDVIAEMWKLLAGRPLLAVVKVGLRHLSYWIMSVSK